MTRALTSLFLVLSAALVLLGPTEARAQCVANPVPNEPPICETFVPPPVETGTLTRGGGLVLPPGAAQAGGGPAFDLQNIGRIGIPLSAAYGASDTFEFGVSGTSVLSGPAPWETQFTSWLGQMFFTNATLYGRYSIVPKKFAISAKVLFLGVLLDSAPFAPMWIQVEAPFTTELAEGVRLYWVNNLTTVPTGGFQMQLNTSGTFMFMLNELFYTQALVGTGVGFSSQGAVLPFVDQPIQVGTGGGVVTGENEGIGLAIQAGIAKPTQIDPTIPDSTTSAVTNFGLVATYVKAI